MIFELVIDILQSSVFRIIILVALSVVLYGALCGPQVHRGYPLIGFDMKDGYSRGLAKAQQQWIANGKDLINQGLAQASFQVSNLPNATDILPSSPVASRSSPRLDLSLSCLIDLHTRYATTLGLISVVLYPLCVENHLFQ